MYHDPNTNRNKKRNGKVGLGRRRGRDGRWWGEGRKEWKAEGEEKPHGKVV